MIPPKMSRAELKFIKIKATSDIKNHEASIVMYGEKILKLIKDYNK